jgi:hypothetical protein
VHTAYENDEARPESVDSVHAVQRTDVVASLLVGCVHHMQPGPKSGPRPRPDPRPDPRPPDPHPHLNLLQVILQLARTARVAQLAQCLRLDLADPLAGHVELLAHFLEGAGAAVLETEAELEDASLPAGQ